MSKKDPFNGIFADCNKIEKAFKKEDYKKVIKLCEAFVEEHEVLIGKLPIYKIASHLELEEYSEALVGIGRGLTEEDPYLSPIYADYFSMLGMLVSMMGTPSAALELCKEHSDNLRDDPSELENWPLVLEAYMLVTFVGEQKAQEALDLLEELYLYGDGETSYYIYYLTKGMALAHLGRTDEGTAAFEECYQEDDRTCTLPHLDMAVICSTGGSIFLAQQYYKKAEQCSNFTEEEAATIGDFFFDFGLHQYTAYWYGKITLPELRAEVLPALAFTYYKLADAKTLDTLREAVAIDPLAVQELFKVDFKVSDATELIDAVAATLPNN